MHTGCVCVCVLESRKMLLCKGLCDEKCSNGVTAFSFELHVSACVCVCVLSGPASRKITLK